MMRSCGASWTTGYANSTRPNSSTCCRCYGGHSAPLLPPNVKPSRNGSQLVPTILIDRVRRSLTWSSPPRHSRPSISFLAGIMTEAREETDRQTRLLRWRLLLGEASAEELNTSLSREEQKMDAALGALYDAAEEEGIASPRRSGGLGSSAPRVARWLGDIRTYFPTSVVQVMQRDAIERLHLTSMLL